MATIRPFRAQRFSPDAGCLADLVAPPYDVLSPEQRDALAARSEHNTVWLTLPESLPDDRSKFVKYARSASRLSQWRQEGVLSVEADAALYRYIQTFANPIDGETLSRSSLICLIKLEPYEKGIVLPHEQTFPKHKEDRLRLLEATRTHLECIFGLYEDAGATAEESLGAAPFEPVADITGDDGVRHELSRCLDPTANQAIVDALAAERIWIADGHHRYETALGFRAGLGERDGVVPEDFMMIALSSMQDPGLELLPTHRIVSGWQLTWEQTDDKLQTLFNTRRVANSALANEVRSLHRPGTSAFGVALPGGIGILATLEDPKAAARLIEGEGSELLKTLDVTILHELIFKRLFGIVGTERIAYTRDTDEAVAAVAESPAASFLMNPPSVEDMRQIALGGEKMPQKSTYYYPKLLSGLVFWSLEDFK
jgi:uncharacterized protein (DUF1015 family)